MSGTLNLCCGTLYPTGCYFYVIGIVPYVLVCGTSCIGGGTLCSGGGMGSDILYILLLNFLLKIQDIIDQSCPN